MRDQLNKTKDRRQAIDAYSRTVLKFQKCMFQLHYARNTMEVKPRSIRTEEDNEIIDFAVIYEGIIPKMFFYKIGHLSLLQGFDFISLLMLNFKYLGIDFIDLPIIYQSVFEKIEIWMVWYDDKLKQKIYEFYHNNVIALGLHPRISNLYVLPTYFNKNKAFEEIFKNHEKFGIIFKNEDLDKVLFNPFKFDHSLFKDKRKFKNEHIITYELECFDKELKNVLKNEIFEFNKKLKDFIGINFGGFSDFSHGFMTNILNWSYQHSIIDGIDNK